MQNRLRTVPFIAGPGQRQLPRVECGAKTRAGHPCRAKSLPGKRRCKWHGGCSTGPSTAEGKAKAVANLRQYQGCPIANDADGAGHG